MSAKVLGGPKGILELLAVDGVTVLTVSHEMAFIRRVASEILPMDAGKVIEAGTPEALLNNPTTERGKRFAAKVLGHT